MKTNAINWGNYQIVFSRAADGVITMEVHTKLETDDLMQYGKTMENILHNMKIEGFFDNWIPQKITIYNKFDKIMPVGLVV